MHKAMIKSLNEQFEKHFQQKNGHIMFNPGRINLMGHQSDYVPGQLLATTIQRGAYSVCRLRDDKEVHFYCPKRKHDREMIFSIDQFEIPAKAVSWSDYLKHIITSLNGSANFIQQGFDIMIDWNMPFGAGLATESSIISLLAMSISYIYDFDLADDAIIKIAHQAEVALSPDDIATATLADYTTYLKTAKEHVFYFDARENAYKIFPAFKDQDYSILLIDTLRNRQFNQIKYQRRIVEANLALNKLKSVLPIQNLVDLSLSDYERYHHLLDNPVIEKRLKYIVYENDRVSRAVEAIEKDKFNHFNRLINRSYESLRDIFELTGYELDTVIEAANAQKGVFSASTTDGRLGGTAFAIVKSDALEEVKANLTSIYQDEIGLTPMFDVASLGDRSRILM